MSAKPSALEQKINQVYDLSKTISEAAYKGNAKAFGQGYERLKALSLQEADSHPVFLEALADFTEDHDEALGYYQQAYALAEAQEHKAHLSSLALALALIYEDRAEIAKAYAWINKATVNSISIKEQDLKDEIQVVAMHLKQLVAQ